MALNRNILKVELAKYTFVKIFSENLSKGTSLIYGGDESQKRTDVSIVPFNHLNDLFRIV